MPFHAVIRIDLYLYDRPSVFLWLRSITNCIDYVTHALNRKDFKTFEAEITILLHTWLGYIIYPYIHHRRITFRNCSLVVMHLLLEFDQSFEELRDYVALFSYFSSNCMRLRKNFKTSSEIHIAPPNKAWNVPINMAIIMPASTLENNIIGRNS